MGMMNGLLIEWEANRERRQLTMRLLGYPCSCEPRHPDDQCQTHGYEAWKAREQMGQGIGG